MGDNTGAGHRYSLAARASQHAPGRAAPGVNVLRWRQVLRGEERHLAVLRRWLASMLPDCPARDDVTSVAVELASNALRHTASGRDGWFAMEITRHPSAVRLTALMLTGPQATVVFPDDLAAHLCCRRLVAGGERGRL